MFSPTFWRKWARSDRSERNSFRFFYFCIKENWVFVLPMHWYGRRERDRIREGEREREKIDNPRKFEGKSNFPTILVSVIEDNEIRFCTDQKFLNTKLKIDWYLSKYHNKISHHVSHTHKNWIFYSEFFIKIKNIYVYLHKFLFYIVILSTL